MITITIKSDIQGEGKTIVAQTIFESIRRLNDWRTLTRLEDEDDKPIGAKRRDAKVIIKVK